MPDLEGLMGELDSMEAAFKTSPAEPAPEGAAPAAPEAAASVAEPPAPVEETLPATLAPLPEGEATVPVPAAPAEPELTEVPDRLRAAAEAATPVIDGNADAELIAPAAAEPEPPTRVAEPELSAPVAVLPVPDAPAAAEAPAAPAAPTAETTTAPAEVAPARTIGFSGRVELARDAVNRAVAGYNGLRDRIVKEQQDSSGYKGYGADLIEAEEGRTGITEPEATDEEFKAMESAAEAAKAAFGLKGLPKELKDRLATQRQLKLGRSMARDAQTNWDAQLKKDLGAVTPQLWEKTSRLQREVDGIRTFFLRLGNNGLLQKEVAEIERARAGVLWNILDRKQKQGVEAELKQKQDALAAFENLDGLLARGDMPAELRQVIEAARNGQPYNFGEGMVGGFRREAYAGILNALGLTLPEAAETPAAAAPAPVVDVIEETPIAADEASAGPVPAEQVTEVINEAAKKAAERDSDTQKLQATLNNLSEQLADKDKNKIDTRAVAATVGKLQEQIINLFATQAEALPEIVKSLTPDQQQRLKSAMVISVRGKIDKRADAMARTLQEQNGIAKEAALGAADVFIRIIELITGMTVEQIKSDLGAK